MNLLNIGCGSTFHSDWINIDIVSSSPEVREYDIRKNLPYPDKEFDVCYSSHVLEHLTQIDAKNLLLESYRILKPNGIIRVVVPDLESIVKDYLKALEKADSGIKEAEADYDWMMLELYDQTVRNFSGGEMKKFLINPNITNKDFVKYRIGNEAENYWNSEKTKEKKSIWQKIISKKPLWFIQQSRIMLAKTLVTLIAGNQNSNAFTEGVFRNSGEIHRWMYDRFSLKRLLESVGFQEVKVCSAMESQIPNFNEYNLDSIEGKVRKPDSLFIEAKKL